MALTQRFLFLSGKQTTRVQVGKNGPLARIKIRYLVRTKPKICGTVRKQRCSSRLDPDSCFSRLTKETYGADRRNDTAFVPHESHINYSATLSASTKPDRKNTDLVLKDTKITDPARERMLEQVLLLLSACYKRSIMYQFSLHWFDGTTEVDITFDPTNERPKQPENKKMSSLQDADLTTNDSDRSNIDDRRNSCYLSEAGQRQARENLGPRCVEKILPPTKNGQSQRTEDRKHTLLFCSDLAHCYMMIYFLWLSRRKCALFIFLLLSRRH